MPSERVDPRLGRMTNPPRPTPTIRIATPDDASKFTALCVRTFVSSYSELPRASLDAYVSAAFGYEQQRAELADAHTKVWVVDTGTALVGYVLVRAEQAPVPIPGSAPLAIARLYLEPSCRGQGFGSELFQRVMGHAVVDEHDWLWLTVWDQNTHARSVYESWNFADVGAVGFDLAGVSQTDRVMTRPVRQVG